MESVKGQPLIADCRMLIGDRKQDTQETGVKKRRSEEVKNEEVKEVRLKNIDSSTLRLF